MAKSVGQKLKLLYLLKILSENTDEKHPMPMKRILEELSRYDICAERKTIYADIEDLKQFGFDILRNPSKTEGGYYLASREFELPELKLLVDAVQASRFITAKKSRELIGKLEKLTGKHEASRLQRQVYVANRIKTSNESIYYNVDNIHRGIQDNVQITFQYMEWTLDKKMSPRKNGVKYQISPWALIWQDENYYLVGFDEAENKIKHYRVDKMGTIELTAEKRKGTESFSQFDLAKYTTKMFGMFGGEERMVTMKFSNRLIGVVMDRFGTEADIRKRDEEHFSVRIKVAVSEQFFGWITGLGQEASILAPSEVVNEYEDYLENILKNLKKEKM